MLVALVAYAPYANDIVKGRVRPARAARIMFTLLMVVTLLQQHSLGSGWALAVTVGEGIGSILILALAIRHGEGGLDKSDLICYVLLGISLLVWWLSGSALLSLHLSILADAIAFTPTVRKTWKDPTSETPLFFASGVVAPILSIIAGANYSYPIVLFPAYLALVNGLLVVVMYTRPHAELQPTTRDNRTDRP